MKLVRSIQRAFEILDSFQVGQSRSVSEISRAMGIPKSTAFEILATMVEVGVLARDDASNLYQLGNRLIDFGNRARINYPLNRAAAACLKALRDEFDETVYLTVRDGDQAYYVDCYESTRRLRSFSSIGDKAPLYCTSVGKAILAFLPEEEIETYIDKVTLTPFTANTILDKGRLREEIGRTAARGYSVDDMEHEEGVRCIGAPLRDSDGRVIGAISLSGFAQRISRERETEIAGKVIHSAREISRVLGFNAAQ
jgi:DNA-binding IclR family transcriptional regulator